MMELFIRKQLMIASCVYVGQIIVGFGMGWSAPVIIKLQDPEQTPLPYIINEQEASWIGSLLFIGTITGPYVTGFLSNRRGRKPCLFLGGALCVLSFLVLAIAKNLAMIYAGRIFIGLGTGIIFVINLVYIGEIATTKIRGMLLTITGIFSTFGTLIVFTVAPFVRYITINIIGMGISLAFIVAVLIIPESPLFLLMRGDEEKVKRTLIRLHRDDEIPDILASKPTANKDKPNRDQWKEMFTVKTNRKALFITFTLNVLQQASGVVAVLFFATTIFGLAASNIEPYLSTIIIGITQIVSSCVAPFFVERNGRRTLMLISTASCTISLALLGTYFFIDEMNNHSLEGWTWVPLVTLINFFLSYDLGFGIIPGTFIGEMFTPNVRSTGSTFVITIAWLVGFGITTAFGYILQFGAYVPFWVFTLGCAAAFVFTIIFVPETKGKTLIEIQELLNK